MGILENYYIPFYIYYPSPDTEEQKVHNVLRAFQLMEDADISTKRVKPEDVVKGDLKSILRVLYLLFSKYKTVRTTEGHREIRGKTTTV
jgi:parvin